MTEAIALPDDSRMFERVGDFPRFHAKNVSAWLQDEVSVENQRAASYRLSRRWLNLLAGAMSQEHAISESTNFLLLSVPKVDEIKRVLRFLEESRVQVLRMLASAQPPADRPKHVVAIFGSKDDYERFTAAGYPDHEREIAATGGMHTTDGVPHILLPSADLTNLHSTLVHELVHDCVSHLPLPPWLNEGITQLIEFELVSWRPFQLDREMMGKHAAYWHADSIQGFWSGRSFHLPDDAQTVSYNLAVVLARKILTLATREGFWSFVRDASAADAGQAALQEHVGARLEDLVADFLGEGAWTPRARENES